MDFDKNLVQKLKNQIWDNELRYNDICVVPGLDLRNIDELDFNLNDSTKNLLDILKKPRKHLDYRYDYKFPQFILMEQKMDDEREKGKLISCISIVDEESVEEWRRPDLERNRMSPLRLRLLYHIGCKYEILSNPLQFKKNFEKVYFVYSLTRRLKDFTFQFNNLVKGTKDYLEKAPKSIMLEQDLTKLIDCTGKLLVDYDGESIRNFLLYGKLLK